jgi:hypothetical protein
MRTRIAEIDQDPIAHISRNETLEALHDFGDSMMIGADKVPQILGIAPHRQCSRADKITKHHRELPSLNDRRSRY